MPDNSASCSSGFRISRSAGVWMSPAVAAPEPFLSSRTSISGDSPWEAAYEVLEVEDDVDYVLADALDGRELVCDALDLH